MDIQERYFVAIAATICLVLIGVGFLAFEPTGLPSLITTDEVPSTSCADASPPGIR